MAVDFFAKELNHAQNRFNSVFGHRVVCDLHVRQSLILAICWMGVLKKKIDQVDDKTTVRTFIRKFVKYRNLVNDVFNRMENEIKQKEVDNVEHTRQATACQNSQAL